VRELENLVQRAFLLDDGPTVRIAELTARRGPRDASSGNGDVSFALAKARAIAAFERSFLASVPQRAQGNVTLAAQLCGKERRSLGRLIKKYSIDRSDYARTR
jgi:DNA-binding NtrC family response regulator